MATIPANDNQLTRKIGFISHMDTDFNAEGVTSSHWLYERYHTPGSSGYNLGSKADFPNLKNYVVVRHLLRQMAPLFLELMMSGIAEIMTALAYLKAHPEIKHCEIRVGFADRRNRTGRR